MIVGLLAVGELGIEAGVLVAQSSASGPVILAEAVAQVGRRHVGAVVEEGGVVHLGHAGVVECRLTLVEAVDVFHTRLNLVILGKGARPVELEGVLGKVLLGVVGLTSVGEGAVEHVAEAIDSLGRIVVGREHVAQGEQLAWVTQLALVVEAAVQVVEIALGRVAIGGVLVQDVAACVGHAGMGEAVASVVVVETAKRERHEVYCVGFPAGAELTVVHIHSCSRVVVGVEHVASVGIGVLALVQVVRPMSVLAVVAIVERSHHLVHLSSDIGIAIDAAGIVHTSTHGAGHAIHGGATAAKVGHHNVENSASALGVIFCSRIGNHLNLFNHARRHCLEYLLHVLAAECRVGVTVAVDLERGSAFNPNLVLPIDGYHWHLLEHVEHVAGLRVGIGLHVVAQAVNLGLDQLSLSGDHHLLEGGGLRRQHDGAQLCHRSRLAHLKGALLLLHAHKLHSHHVAARLVNLVVDLAKGVAHPAAHHGGGVATIIYIDCGKGHSLAIGIIHLALYTKLLRNHSKGACKHQ